MARHKEQKNTAWWVGGFRLGLGQAVIEIRHGLSQKKVKKPGGWCAFGSGLDKRS
jgi:hypothetical protein